MSITAKIILAFLGLVFLGYAYFQYTASGEFLSDSIVTTGKVVDFYKVKRVGNTSVDPLYDVHYPIVEFTIKNGTAIRITSKTGTYPPEQQIGERMQVRYEKANPHNAKLDNYSESWGIPTFLAGVGIILIVLSVLPIKRP